MTNLRRRGPRSDQHARRLIQGQVLAQLARQELGLIETPLLEP